MDDQISRQAAIKIIKNYCENGCDIAEDNWCPSCQREQFIKLLEALSPAQPEIVRCKDCKHVERARSEESARKFGQIYICGQHVLLSPKLDDYCSLAERRTDDREETMDPIKDISKMIPRLDILRLRKAEAMISYEDIIESWEAIRRGEDFRKTALGKTYRKCATKRVTKRAGQWEDYIDPEKIFQEQQKRGREGIYG